MSREPETRLVYTTGGEAPREQPRGEPVEADPGPIRLHLERRASGRVVTVLTGLPGSEIQALGRTLKAACGTGGGVKNGTLELQGDHRERVEAALRARGMLS